MGLFDLFKSKEEKVLKQKLGRKAEFRHLFTMEILFEEQPKLPGVDKIKEALEEKFGDVDIVSGAEGLSSFAIKKYKAVFKEGSMPPQLLFMGIADFDGEKITDIERSQLWNVPDGNEVIEKCNYKLTISDMMAATMDYKERCEMLMDYLEVVLRLMPEAYAVWMPKAGKLTLSEEILKFSYPREHRFIYYCVNARFFNIQGTEDMVVDTLGLYTMGLPDVQYHFHSLDPNDVVNHAYNTAIYIFENNAPINSGETIAGLKDGRMDIDVKWRCNYEMALIEPERELMDIEAVGFASGNREY